MSYDHTLYLSQSTAKIHCYYKIFTWLPVFYKIEMLC